MRLEWIAEDATATIGHATRLDIGNHKILSPAHLLATKDMDIAEKLGQTSALGNSGICIAGRSLSYLDYKGVGKNTDATKVIFDDLSKKVVKNKANIVFQRIPSHHTLNKGKPNEATIEVKGLDELQTAGMVGIQLELKADLIIPPLYTEIHDPKQALDIYDRTKVELQTFNTKSEVMGFIPTTHDLELVSELIRVYVKDGINVFGVDFSSSPLNRWLLRTIVSKIRKNLKINGKVGEKTDKQYYLHVFDAPSSQKTASTIAPITDILTPIYGVDSTSGVIWGGGKLIKDQLRYFDMPTYGAYQIKVLDEQGINYNKSLVSGSATEVYEKLRTKKNVDYNIEAKRITSLLKTEENPYGAYLTTKTNASDRIKDALIDVKEIKANS